MFVMFYEEEKKKAKEAKKVEELTKSAFVQSNHKYVSKEEEKRFDFNS